MKKLILVCGFASALVGCAPSEDFMDSLFGIRHNVAVLAPSAIELSTAGMSLTPSTEAEVVGKESRVCVVLAGDAPLKDSAKEMERLLNGAKL